MLDLHALSFRLSVPTPYPTPRSVYTSECSAVFNLIPLNIERHALPVSQPSVVTCESTNVQTFTRASNGLLAKLGYLFSLPSRSAVTQPLHPPFPLPTHPTVPSLSFFSPFVLLIQRPFPYDIPIMATKQQVTSDAVDDGPPISVQDCEDTGESGKLKMIVQLVRKCMGIKDIASMCVSAIRSGIRF